MQAVVPNDLYRFVLAADPLIEPAGTAVIYRHVVIDPEKDSATGSLWRLESDGAAKPFTSGPDDRYPRLNAEGSWIAFVRHAEENARIFVMSMESGVERAVGEEYKAISSIAWSPDGRQIAYVATAAFDSTTAHIYVDERTKARHIRALPYKSDPAGLLDGRRAHLFVLDLTTGVSSQLTSGDFDAADPCWSPDGRAVAIAISAVMESSMIADIAVVDVASAKMRRVTHSSGPSSSPAYSPDGVRLAWFGHQHGNDTRYGNELIVAHTDGAGSLFRPLHDEPD
jgi:Tol biopolymer transport system component